VEVAALLRHKGLRFEWRHYGDGPRDGAVRERVLNEISRAGVSAVLKLCGETPNVELREAMRNSDVMIHTAKVAEDGTREAFGVSLVEAAACGLPIVSCPVGGIPEIVRDGETGFLEEPCDYEGIAERVAELSRSAETRLRMGHAAHRHARENFEEGAQSRALDDFYDHVIAGNKSRA
jgi:glycosyltransferase involved in cell wall biosynthesis